MWYWSCDICISINNIWENIWVIYLFIFMHKPAAVVRSLASLAAWQLYYGSVCVCVRDLCVVWQLVRRSVYCAPHSHSLSRSLSPILRCMPPAACHVCHACRTGAATSRIRRSRSRATTAAQAAQVVDGANDIGLPLISMSLGKLEQET